MTENDFVTKEKHESDLEVLQGRVAQAMQQLRIGGAIGAILIGYTIYVERELTDVRVELAGAKAIAAIVGTQVTPELGALGKEIAELRGRIAPKQGAKP